MNKDENVTMIMIHKLNEQTTVVEAETKIFISFADFIIKLWSKWLL